MIHLIWYAKTDLFDLYHSELKILNKGLEVVNVEEEIINNNAPIINKNKNNNVSYSPYVEKEYENYL